MVCAANLGSRTFTILASSPFSVRMVQRRTTRLSTKRRAGQVFGGGDQLGFCPRFLQSFLGQPRRHPHPEDDGQHLRQVHRRFADRLFTEQYARIAGRDRDRPYTIGWRRWEDSVTTSPSASRVCHPARPSFTRIRRLHLRPCRSRPAPVRPAAPAHRTGTSGAITAATSLTVTTPTSRLAPRRVRAASRPDRRLRIPLRSTRSAASRPMSR